MPYTTPLAKLPVTWPTPQTRIVDANGRPTPEFYTLLQQIRRYLEAADAALREVEP